MGGQGSGRKPNIGNMFNAGPTVQQPTPQGNVGFDNPRENIDPLVLTKYTKTFSGAHYGDGSGLSNLPAGTEADPIWGSQSGAYTKEVNYAITSGAFLAHSGAANIHFTEASISHDSIADVSANDHHAQSHNINTHVMGDNKIIHTKAAGAITEIGLGAAGTFLRSAGEGSDMTFAVPTDTTDHTALSNIGTTTHADIDIELAEFAAHSGAAAIHFVDPGFLTAEADPIWGAQSGAFTLETNYAVTSGAYLDTSGAVDTHFADNTDPHGATLSQTNINSSGDTNMSGAVISGDNTASGAGYIANTVFATTSGGITASDYPIGSLLVVYTA